MVASLSVRLRRHSKAVHEYRQRGLTLPSRGRPTSGFASCRPPLMSNVRPRRMHLANHFNPDHFLNLAEAPTVTKEDVLTAWERTYAELRQSLSAIGSA